MILDIQDIINSVSVPTLIKDEFIKRGKFAMLGNGDLQACVGGFSVVFPVEVDGSKWAFRCWHHTLDDDQVRIKLLSAELKKAALPYFMDFVYEDHGVVVNGAVYPTTRMKWINGRDIKGYICYNKNNRHKLFNLASNFFALTRDLHSLSIAHGDLQHENIIVDQYGRLFLIDYDSMYVPALAYMNSKNSTNGKEGYQHPARENCVYSNPKLDYFSEVVILTSILAVAHNPSLVDKYKMADSDTMLFKKADFQNFASSRVYSDLSSMGEIFVILLNVISSYLREQDITDLDPLEVAVNKANPTNAINISDYLNNVDTNLVKVEEEAAAEKECGAQAIIESLEKPTSWEYAQSADMVAVYKRYLDQHPEGINSIRARRRIEEILGNYYKMSNDSEAEAKDWERALSEPHIEKLIWFINKYPGSRHLNEAKELIEFAEWKSIRCANDEDKLRRFINNYPDSRYVDTARIILEKLSEAAWKQAQDKNTVQSYADFIKKYPDSVHYMDAVRKRLEISRETAEAWRQAKASNTIKALDDFIKKWPDSVLVAEARTIISNKQARLKEDRAWHAARNRDAEAAWKQAQDKNTVASYTLYLQQYPHGRYALAAKNMIDDLKKDNKRSKVCWCIAAILIIAIIILLIVLANETYNGTGIGSVPTRNQVEPPQPMCNPPYAISDRELSDLESKTEKFIKSMEIAKSVGDSRDANMYRLTGQSLNKLKNYGSSKYKALNDRYKAL